MSKFYTTNEIADMFRVRVFTVWDWIKKGKLHAVKIGRDFRVSEADVEDFLNNSKLNK